MEKKSEPLLFINSVTTPIDDNHSQKKFDSRSKKQETKELVLNNEILDKIDSLIEKYQLDQPVSCTIISKETIQGIPCDRNNEVLFLKIKDKEYQINLESITDIIIPEK